MAIFHMNFTNISAGKGRSAIASAAYRSGEKLYSEMEGKKYYYARDIMPETFILTPKNAPEWAKDRQKLWNEVEAKDRFAHSRYAKEFNVALPIELNEEEQKELLKEYVQKNFVDSGMVADVAIHRDTPGNPHAHVMLTNRPFNPDGTWGLKSRKEYILDENGNKTYTKSGYARNRKIWLVDWDKKGKVEEWRKEWAKAVNQVFEQKNIPDRISEKSLKEQGIDQVATQHIGVTGKRHEREAFNKQVTKNRRTDAQLRNIDEKVQNEQKVQTLQKHFSFNEKKVISELSKELQTFVSLESLEEKKRMLFNWKNSVLIKQAVGEDVAQQLTTIHRQEESLDKANELLDKVVDRTIKELYPTVSIEQTTIAERRELIKETESEQKVFTGEELKDRLAMIRSDILNKQILTFTKRPYVSWLLLEKQAKQSISNIENVLVEKGYKFADIERSKGAILQNFDGKEKARLERGIKDLKTVNEIRNIVKTQYAGVLQKTFPEIDMNQLPMMEKERIYNAIVYFNPELKAFSREEFNKFKENPPMQFTTKEHQQGINYLKGLLKIEDIKNKNLVRVLENEGTKQLFIGESSKDPNIKKEEIDQIKKITQKNNSKIESYRKEQMNSYQSVHYKETTPHEYLKNLFNETIMRVLYTNENQKRQQETEWEMEKKKRQHEKSNSRSL